jgi:hypothetical protein
MDYMDKVISLDESALYDLIMDFINQVYPNAFTFEPNNQGLQMRSQNTGLIVYKCLPNSNCQGIIFTFNKIKYIFMSEIEQEITSNDVIVKDFIRMFSYFCDPVVSKIDKLIPNQGQSTRIDKYIIEEIQT